MTKDKKKNESEKELLEASVISYLEMRDKELSNTQKNLVKTTVYRELNKRFPNKTPKYFEFLMQNISFIYDEWREPWIRGLKPLRNIGKNIKKDLIVFIKEHDPSTNIKRDFFASTSSRVVDINEKNINPSKTKRSKKEIVIQQNEEKLRQRYSKFLKEKEQIDLKKNQIDIVGENSTLETDGWIEKTMTLIEAKYFKQEQESPREKIRMAIGQLHDYKRHLETKPKRLAVLLPSCPIHDLVELLHSQKIDIIYEQEKKFITSKYDG